MSPSSAGESAIRAWLEPWRTDSSIVPRIESIMSCRGTPWLGAAAAAVGEDGVLGAGSTGSWAAPELPSGAAGAGRGGWGAGGARLRLGSVAAAGAVRPRGPRAPLRQALAGAPAAFP